MFDVEARNEIPIQQLQIFSFWIRGRLGKITIWYTSESYRNRFDLSNYWTKIYDSEVELKPSAEFTELRLLQPLILPPGGRYGVYIHSSTDPNAIVYDDERNPVTFENSVLRVHSGLANISPVPFSTEEPLPGWHWPWRPRREFVGKISFGVKYILWRPLKDIHQQFNQTFRRGVEAFFLCCTSRKGFLKFMIRDVTYLILNMLPFDWFEKTGEESENGVLHFDDRRRVDGDAIGWGGDWRIYRDEIREHMLVCASLVVVSVTVCACRDIIKDTER